MIIPSIDFGGIRNVFIDAGYTDAGVIEALRIHDYGSIKGDDVELLLRRTEQATPLNILIRLFCIDTACGIEDFAGAVVPMSVREWTDAGLVTVDRAMVRACLKILPYHNLLLAFDPSGTLITSRAGDYVMEIGSNTLTLANLTIRKPSRKPSPSGQA
jgi:hypothetical protein